MRSIPTIDKDITAVQRQLLRLERINTTSAKSWQAAWDRHPELRERESGLFLERGLAQRARDEAQAKMASKRAWAWRAPKRKKCPACGSMVLT